MGAAKSSKKLRLTWLVFIGITMVQVLVIIGGTLIVVGLVGAKSNVANVGESSLPAIESLSEMSEGMDEVLAGEQSLIVPQLFVDQELREARFDAVSAAFQKIQEGWDAYALLPKSVEEEQLWERFQVEYRDWEAAQEGVLSYLKEKEQLLDSGVGSSDPRVTAIDDAASTAHLEAGDEWTAARATLGDVTRLGYEAGYSMAASAKSKVTTSVLIAVIILSVAFLSVLVMEIYFYRLVKAIIEGLLRETQQIIESATEGNLSVRGNPENVNVDFRGVIEGFNKFLDELMVPLGASMNVLTRMGEGDFSVRIEEDFRGDYKIFKDNLNVFADVLNSYSEEISRLTEEASEGNLSYRADASKFKGDFAKVIDGTNQILDGIDFVLSTSLGYLASLGAGEVPGLVTEEFKGDFNIAKESLNTIIGSLNMYVEETNRLTEEALDGSLSYRADASKFKGDFAKVIDGINKTLDAMIEPVNAGIQVMEGVASRGDLGLKVTGDFKGDHQKFKNSVNSVIDYLDKMASLAKQIAERKLDITVEPLSEKDIFGKAFKTMSVNLNDALFQVSAATGQVGPASEQISSISQSLAQGSSEQASSMEEVTSSVEEITVMSRQNADSASQAMELAQEAKSSTMKANDSMNRMAQAIEDIKASADETSRIIKTIDEIAFQTNLLALNAAVEAARAGEVGKGFAVVAEEVRNLAMRSAESAKNTANLIENSVKNTNSGVEIVNEVADSLVEISVNFGKVNNLVEEISASSKDQVQGISQINTALSEMDKVTQSNAAISEESASAAEEMASQVLQLKAMLATFELTEIKEMNAGLDRMDFLAPTAPMAAQPAIQVEASNPGSRGRKASAAEKGEEENKGERPGNNRRSQLPGESVEEDIRLNEDFKEF
ncbi:MAG: methyl-accepting chemotaxis protein [Actinomycetota bacterium]|nr:methyl-accepting chemotaxis protein [Actinomycetota bacterium]